MNEKFHCTAHDPVLEFAHSREPDLCISARWLRHPFNTYDEGSTMSLRGKVAVVTGGTRGIGRAIVDRFVAEGARVAFNGRNAATGEQAQRELKARGGDVLFVQGDARFSADVQRLIEAAVQRWGQIDIMVNNVGGVTEPAMTVNMADEAWENDIALNLHSTFYGTKYALKHMIPRQSGRIINISSVEGKVPMPAMSGYVAAKHAMIGLTKNVAREVGKLGITVNAVCPGLVLTDAVIQGGPATAAAMGLTMEEMTAAFANATAIGRPNTLEEVASLVAYLADDCASGITGAALSVDGAMAPY
jgi:3-hydroxybutyrate dehydrogenase